METTGEMDCLAYIALLSQFVLLVDIVAQSGDGCRVSGPCNGFGSPSLYRHTGGEYLHRLDCIWCSDEGSAFGKEYDKLASPRSASVEQSRWSAFQLRTPPSTRVR